MYIDQMKSGVRVQIQRPGAGPNEGFMCKVEVVLSHTKEVLIHAPMQGGRLVDLPKGDRFVLRLQTDKSVYQFKAILMEYLKEDGFDVIKFRITDQGEKVQRRDAFRFICAIPVTYSTVSNSGQMSSPETGLIIDLSAGGVKINASKSMQIKDFLNITMQLDDDLMVAFAEVCTKKEITGNDKYKFQYGIKFAMMPPSDQEKIVRYIYKAQREELKKARPRNS
jgi:c-di-GMP-binding flagellar brake protein YcgR